MASPSTPSELAIADSTPALTAPTAYIKIDFAADAPALLPMQYVQEVLALPSHRLTPMPNMAPGVLGLMNRRSRVLWVLDLAHLMGLHHPLAHSQQYPMVIMRVGAISLGLAIHKVGNITWYPASAIASPPTPLDPTTQPFVVGHIPTEPHSPWVLSAEAIVRSEWLKPL
jgi:positive phototaxis protein PixI